MAYGQERVNGRSDDFGAMGRTAELVYLEKNNMSQDELNAVIEFLQLTTSIIAVSDFVAGSTDAVYVLVEGEPVEGGSNFGGVTGVDGSVTTTFTAGH